MPKTKSKPKKSMLMKFDKSVFDELELIQKKEGFGSRTATVTFLVKYYIITKYKTFEQKLELLDKLLGDIDPDSLPSLREQLKDV